MLLLYKNRFGFSGSLKSKLKVKGSRKEGSWEALKIGSWEKEGGLEAGKVRQAKMQIKMQNCRLIK